MVERNLIKEGFVINTLTASGVVSGTQVVSIPQINALVNDDITTAALTVSGGELISLDADLGSRWKLTRLEYHTNETSASNFSMSISDDEVDFFPVTFTGNAPLYVGDISPTTVSGAPRFIRFEHTPSVDREAREWKAISDDSLVDFGSDGTQTEITIKDAPIGKVSSQVETLTLFNRFTKSANGFIYIDPTGTDADDNIEVALNENGPFFGRNTNNAVQPDNTPWEEGTLTNTRVVPKVGYSVDFKDGTAKNWGGGGMSSSSVVGGVFVGTTSSTTPDFRINNNFGNTYDENFFAFRTDDYDTVKATIKVPTLQTNDITEGPRLFWRDQGDDSFDNARSILSTVPSGNFSNVPKEFTFNVGNAVTWSGVARSFKLQLYTTTTGVGILTEFHDFEVSHSSNKDRVAIDFFPVPSGVFPDLTENTNITGTDNFVILDFRHKITQPCIITKVNVYGRPPQSATDISGVFLCSLTGTSFPAPGSNFNVKRVARIQEKQDQGSGTFGVFPALMEIPVFWPAEPGDFIGYTDEDNWVSGTARIRFVSGGPSDVFQLDLTLPEIVELSSASAAKADLDALDFTGAEVARNYLITYEAVSAGKFLSSGNYTTEIFDGGGQPALTSLTFEKETENNTSIDISGNEAFDTINARASDSPPKTAFNLGDFTEVFYKLNDDTPAAELGTFSINQANSVVTAREVTGTDIVQNVGCAVLYHQNKDELWVLNVLASGTQPNNFRPIWDVFEVATGDYKRTQAVGGTISYSYQHPLTGDLTSFEGVGFLADYDKNEIYIIQRENAFFLGASTYYGIKLDLDGTFKDVMFRAGDLGSGISSSQEILRFGNCISIAYDGTYFYFLTDDTAATPFDLGHDINIFKVGNATNPNDIEFVQRIEISTIPGLSFVSDDETTPKAISYNSRDGLFYLYFHNTTGTEGIANRNPEFYAISLVPDTNDVFTASFVKSATAPDLAKEVEGFSLQSATENSLDDWSGMKERKLDYTSGMTFIPSRDSFGILQTLRSSRSPDFVDVDSFSTDFFLNYLHSFSFFIEAGAGNVSNTILPGKPADTDAIWGTLSGTLSFQQVQDDSVLFPTGRFAQVEYTLNSDPAQQYTPYLVESQLTQGLKVLDIPAEGTKNIFLRTNIPEGTSVAEQQGRLKVFWELDES